jgi:hypothetical protein
MGFLFGRRGRGEREAAVATIDRAPGMGPVEAPEPLAVPIESSPEEEGEAAMPRWRRPSLMAARKEAPGTSLRADAAHRLRFATTTRLPADTAIHIIRYRMVQLTDRPDEIYGIELDRLDEGDEVEVLERVGGYVRVRTPLGQEGWVHRTTVGERIGTSVDPYPSVSDPAPQVSQEPVDLGAVFGDQPEVAYPDSADMSPAARILEERLSR